MGPMIARTCGREQSEFLSCMPDARMGPPRVQPSDDRGEFNLDASLVNVIFAIIQNPVPSCRSIEFPAIAADVRQTGWAM